MNIGIWERSGRVSGAVSRALDRAGRTPALRAGSHPADFASRPLSLLCISPDGAGWAGLGAVDCGVLLLPGMAGPLARGLRCRSAVSYGTSPKDSLTFSSLEGDQICLALQRELVALDGQVVEQQEFVLPFPAGTDPLEFLAAAGVLLLAGADLEHLAWGVNPAPPAES